MSSFFFFFLPKWDAEFFRKQPTTSVNIFQTAVNEWMSEWVCGWAVMGTHLVLSHFRVSVLFMYLDIILMCRWNWIDAQPCCVERCAVIAHNDSLFRKLCQQSAAPTLRLHGVRALLLRAWNITIGCKQILTTKFRYCPSQAAFRIILIIQMRENLRYLTEYEVSFPSRC